jgi:alkaline phosphatase
VPFWNAFANGLSSIEVDVFLEKDTLFVAHHKKEISKDRTIENLYLKPMQQVISLELGDQDIIQLLVDVKTEAEPTLRVLMTTLERYPNLINSDRISIVISGNQPSLSKQLNYPNYINFDYQSLAPIQNPKIWDKIALISLDFKRFSEWNGKGRLTDADYKKVTTYHKKRPTAITSPFDFGELLTLKRLGKCLVPLVLILLIRTCPVNLQLI